VKTHATDERATWNGELCRLRLAACVCAVAALGLLAGCAGSGRLFVDEPGISADVALTDGEVISGRLMGYEGGALVIERALVKSEELTVVRKNGEAIAYVQNVPMGVAVEVRDFDIVVRQKIPLRNVEDAEVATRTLFGWGTAVAALLAFGLVQILQDQ
jgi:hypothetical protein